MAPYQNNKSGSGTIYKGRRINNYDPLKDRSNVAYHKQHVDQVGLNMNKRQTSPLGGASKKVNDETTNNQSDVVNDEEGWQIVTGTKRRVTDAYHESRTLETPIVIRHKI